MPESDSRPSHWARRWRRWLLVGTLGAAMLVIALAVGTVAWLTPQLPALDPVLAYQPRQHLQILTRDGVEIGQFGAERRQFVPIAEVPEQLKQAVLSVEDKRYYQHRGIDLRGLARAVVAQLTGGMRQGASTITQQVARNFFLSHRFTLERKLKEALLALEMERQLDKDRILELYLNQIFLGHRAYGFEAAAQTYFGKSLNALSLAETAMLAGLPQNPYYANPFSNLARAQKRQHTVLSRMVTAGAITAEQAAAARAEPLVLRDRDELGLRAEFVAELARQAVVDRFGAQAYSQGLRVITSIRAADQAAAWQAVSHGVLNHDAGQAWRGPEGQESLPRERSDDERAALEVLKGYSDHDWLRPAVVLEASRNQIDALLPTGERLVLTGNALRLVRPALSARRQDPALAIQRGSVIRVRQLGPSADWQITQWPAVEAALVSMDPHTGRVRALVGGFDYGRQPFNHVTQAWRQPGSAFKPILYSAALEAGVMPDTLINDAALDSANGWDPKNSDGQYDGPIALRTALERSKNLVSVRVLDAVGVPAVRDWAARFGLDRSRQPDSLTLALGTGSATPLQMAQAYSVLANGGWRVPPVVIERITDTAGTVLFQAAEAPERIPANRAIPARNAFIINSMLNGVTRTGTAARAQQLLKRRDLYGKTGTTNEAVDAWFAGFQPGLVSVVWMGHDRPRSLGTRASGGALALPIWIDYMRVALDGVPALPEARPPNGVVRDEGDWRYAELSGGRGIARIDVQAPEPTETLWPVATHRQGTATAASGGQAGAGGTSGTSGTAGATSATRRHVAPRALFPHAPTMNIP